MTRESLFLSPPTDSSSVVATMSVSGFAFSVVVVGVARKVGVTGPTVAFLVEPENDVDGDVLGARDVRDGDGREVESQWHSTFLWSSGRTRHLQLLPCVLQSVRVSETSSASIQSAALTARQW